MRKDSLEGPFYPKLQFKLLLLKANIQAGCMKSAVLFVLGACSLGDVLSLLKKKIPQSLRLLQCIGLLKMSPRLPRGYRFLFAALDLPGRTFN